MEDCIVKFDFDEFHIDDGIGGECILTREEAKALYHFLWTHFDAAPASHAVLSKGNS